MAKARTFIFGTVMASILGLHTQDRNYTSIDAHSYRYRFTKLFTLCTFWLIWHTCQRYLAYHRIAHAPQTLRHMSAHILHADIKTHIQVLHWDTIASFGIHTQIHYITHLAHDVHVGIHQRNYAHMKIPFFTFCTFWLKIVLIYANIYLKYH